MNTYKFVKSETELEKYYNFLVEGLFRDQVLFFSLSARNKCLTLEEREEYKLGRSEMMEKTIVRKYGFQHFLTALYSKECRYEGMLTKSRLPYPEKCLRVYFNINPTNVLKVMDLTSNMIQETKSALINAYTKDSITGIDDLYYKVRRFSENSLSFFAQGSSDRIWCDYEIDFSEGYQTDQYFSFCEKLNRLLKNYDTLRYMFLTSPHGIHITVKRETLKIDFLSEIKDLVSTLITKYNKLELAEVIRNVNEMTIPAGTIAYTKDGEMVVPRILD